MSVNLLTKHHLEFLSFRGGFTGWSDLHMSKCHIVGNRMSRLIYNLNLKIADNKSELEITGNSRDFCKKFVQNLKALLSIFDLVQIVKNHDSKTRKMVKDLLCF